jgi:hypothetical protein
VPNLVAMLDVGVVSGALYTATVTTVALAAVFARRPARRRAARHVLVILLLRKSRVSRPP